MIVILNVEGIPGPKGSKTKANNRFGMRESSKKVKPWEAAVRRVASAEADRLALFEPLTQPYRVDIWFYIERPKRTRATHPVAPSVGDLDKLVRATLDPLKTGGLLTDDRHVVEVHASKAWAGDGEKPGAIIRITEQAGITWFRPDAIQEVINARLGEKETQ